MLSTYHCELINAFIDDELDDQERQVVERLLASSPEAQSFLDQMMRDSKELQSLLSRKAPPTLADAVMETLAENRQPVKPIPLPPPAPATRTFPLWLGLALAGGVLIAVATGAFFMLDLLLKH